jgi:hypothetical protein
VAIDKQERAGTVFWLILATGLEGAECERVIDEGLDSLPADRLKFARGNARRFVDRLEDQSETVRAIVAES